MEKRLPHITAEMEHQSFRARRRGDVPDNGLHSSDSGNTDSRTVEVQSLREEKEARKHREELAQIGPNVIG